MTKLKASLGWLRDKLMKPWVWGHLPGNLPHFDHILAQKVSLELDEEAFVRICNRLAA